VRVVTAEPQTDEMSIAGVVTTIVHAGGGRHRAVVLVPGFVEHGRQNPVVLRTARGLARAGFVVFVPDLPGLGDGELVPATVKAAVDLANDVLLREDVKAGKVDFAGAWAGATVGLLAAEDPVLAPRVGLVAGVAPWAAAPNVIRLATTGYSLENGTATAYAASPALAVAVGRSLVAALRPSSARTQLLELLHGVSPLDRDPLRAVRGLARGQFPPDAAAVVSLLANRRPAVFDTLYAALPGYLKSELEQLSPLVGAGQLQADVELATSSHDRFSPPSESRALARASTKVHVTTTGGVSNGVPDPSLGETPTANGWLVGAIHAS
jgi:dienelactone hydrolase